MPRFRLAPPAGILAILLVSALLAACTTRVQTATSRAGLAADLDAGPPVALGGVTVATEVGATLAPDDRAEAEAALYRAFLTARPDLIVWPVPAVAGAAGADPLAAVLASHARGGRPAPAALAALAAGLPDGRYLALARLTADEVRSDAQRQDTQNPEARAEGLPEHASAWATTVTVTRRIGLELTLLDLATGEVAWQATATTRDRQRYAYEDALGRDPADYLRDRLEAAAQERPAHLSRHGTSLRQPDLVALLERGLTELVGRLPGPDAP